MTIVYFYQTNLYTLKFGYSLLTFLHTALQNIQTSPDSLLEKSVLKFCFTNKVWTSHKCFVYMSVSSVELTPEAAQADARESGQNNDPADHD